MSYVEFIAGCNAGVFGVLVGHPFDTIKVKLQLDAQNSVRTLYQQENVISLYRGISSPLICLALINALVFGAYGNCLRLHDESERMLLSTQIRCGLAAGAAQSLIASPMELVRCRMQTSTCATNGIRTELKKLLAQPNRINAFYRGLGLTIARDSPAFGIYFGSYEWLLRRMSRVGDDTRPTNSEILFAGGLAGMLSWALVYPVDVLKTKVQLNSKLTWKSCLRQMYVQGGLSGLVKGLNRGLLTTLIRAFPVNAASFFAYDLTVRQIAK